MGTDKALLKFNGRRLIDYPYALLKRYCDRIIVCSNAKDYSLDDVIYVVDNYADAGPIAGIEAGLRASKTALNVILPCDTPLLSDHLIPKMLELINDHDCIIPVHGDGVQEPLIGIFHKRILSVVSRQIDSGNMKVKDLIRKLDAASIYCQDICTPQNINSPTDMMAMNHYFEQD